MSLPSADELFRPTGQPDPEQPTGASPGERERKVEPRSEEDPTPSSEGERRPSGRVRHDEKMTVYVTADELLDLEHARLQLRRSHRLAVDRGRLVREAVAIALADLELNGDDSVLVQRLSEQ